MAEPLNATFYTFQQREPGGVLLRAGLAFFMVAAILIAAFVGVFWSALAPVIQWYIDVLSNVASGGDPSAMNIGELPPSFFGVIGGIMLWMMFFYILYAAFEAACLRWMIRGETGGFMGLTLGADTWRIYFTYWMWFLLYLAFSMVMGIVMAVLMGVMLIGGGAASADPGAMVMISLGVFYLLQYGLMIYFAVRFAPAGAASIARRKFAFFDAWTITKGRFWALFGAFLLLGIIYCVFAAVYFGAWFGLLIGAAAPDLSNIGADQQAWTQAYLDAVNAMLQSMLQPSNLALLIAIQVVGGIGALTYYMAMFGVNARAARAALDEGKIAASTA